MILPVSTVWPSPEVCCASASGRKNGMIIELPKKPSTRFSTQLSSGIICVASSTPPGGTPIVYASSKIARSSADIDDQIAREYVSVSRTTCCAIASISRISL